MSPTAKDLRRSGGERGFTLLQVIIVLGIMGVVSTMAIFGIRAARSTSRLNNSARDFAQYSERARLDAIRRRATTHVEFTGPNTFEVTMDFTGDGYGETRTFTLDEGVVLADANGNTVSSTATDLPWADFDWRGRTYECNALFRLKNTRGEQTVVQIAGSGDITVNSTISSTANVNFTNVNATSDVLSSVTLNGNSAKINLSPCGTISATPTPTPTPEATPTPESTPETQPCSMSLNPTEITDLKRRGGGTASLAVTVNQPGTIDKTVDSNLTATTSSSETVTASQGTTITYSVQSGNNSTGKFPINFEFANCNPQILYVTVVK